MRQPGNWALAANPEGPWATGASGGAKPPPSLPAASESGGKPVKLPRASNTSPAAGEPRPGRVRGCEAPLPRPLSRDHRRETSEETLPSASGPPRGLPGRTPHFGHGGGRRGGQAAPVGGLSSPPSPGSSRRVNPRGSEAGAPGSCSLPTALQNKFFHFYGDRRIFMSQAQDICGAHWEHAAFTSTAEQSPPCQPSRVPWLCCHPWPSC